VAARARHVRIDTDAIPGYAAGLELPGERPADPASAAAVSQSAETQPRDTDTEQRAAFWITLGAINFGSGWFPTLRKRARRSGYHTIAGALADRFDRAGRFPAAELREIEPGAIGAILGQDPDHELMALFAASLRDLGAHVEAEHGGRFLSLAEAACGSAVTLARHLGAWDCFADTSVYDGLSIPFLKRAQIAAADLARAGVTQFRDLDQLTMFADNLVPHVLRLDGILHFDPALVRRIEAEELIENGSPEEVEIRACTLHAVELIVAAHGRTCAAEVDQFLWQRGQEPRYKARPRHRSRCTAY
jgi:hypothetical protein